jgi:hypothetical protein
LKRPITLLVCLFFWASAANVAVIYDNLGSVSAADDPLSLPGPPLFNTFSVGAAGFTLKDVKLNTLFIVLKSEG